MEERAEPFSPKKCQHNSCSGEGGGEGPATNTCDPGSELRPLNKNMQMGRTKTGEVVEWDGEKKSLL